MRVQCWSCFIAVRNGAYTTGPRKRAVGVNLLPYESKTTHESYPLLSAIKRAKQSISHAKQYLEIADLSLDSYPKQIQPNLENKVEEETKKNK